MDLGDPAGDSTVVSIYAHGERRRARTVTFSNGKAKNMSIYRLIGKLIENRGK